MDRRQFGPMRRDFPSGIRLLVVDSDFNNLMTMRRTLDYFGYHVSDCRTAMEALSLLQQKHVEFDILLSEAYLLDMDGFEFVAAATAVNRSMEVVLFSGYPGFDVAIRSLRHGACAFYPKPIPMEVLKHIWQHVFHKKIESCGVDVLKRRILPPLPVSETEAKIGATLPPLPVPELDSLWAKIGAKQKRKRDDLEKQKQRPRICWTPELHDKFLAAVEIVGADNLFPRRILDCMEQMGVSGLSRPQVSSHLQQYLRNMKGCAEESIKPSNNTTSDDSDSRTHDSASSAGLGLDYSVQIPTALVIPPRNDSADSDRSTRKFLSLN